MTLHLLQLCAKNENISTKETYKISLILDEGGVNDQSFNQSAWEGLQKAEKELGAGTGQIKLRYVYDLFIDKFKFSSMFITFSQFSLLVDSALIIMKVILTDNKNVQEYVAK